MKGVRELRSRLRGVRNIQKITKAMEMVAATKLRRLQERALATRPYAERIEELMRRVAPRVDPGFSPLLGRPEPVQAEALLVVGADRGLCGSYNANLHRAALQHFQSLGAEGVQPLPHVLGRRAQSWLRKLRDHQAEAEWPDKVEAVTYTDARRYLRELVEAFVSGRVQRVRVLYTHMRSMAVFEPRVRDLLPVGEETSAGGAEGEVDYIIEPSPVRVMEQLLPRHLEMQVYSAVLESLASEFAARRMAMKNATDNADEMIDDLTMEYNKARQAGITGELLDIIGGATAQQG